MRPRPHASVVAWVSAQPRDNLYTTSITRAELLHGVAAMPQGKRRDTLGVPVEVMFAEDFAGRVLPFDADAAPHYARIVASRGKAGRPIEGFDALIAATVASAGASIATRDVGGFSGCGLTVIDPWRG
ncbi:VapC toxin family PIN domain ribonuclease [Methylobacterium terrae]|uniref:VapC toxin family PIN domain ribonuclease n=1 Tax=Methylobacterium terrae TaxID=2202827 RepID=A0A2U8WGQ6_9HYPH|nr:type II toxin-antitoxin system VapC family toxin [Methylobacterium terrae]AWN45415.1 VapC toxin family PIN domain ribonuclease [Methylobacterium terrae]